MQRAVLSARWPVAALARAIELLAGCFPIHLCAMEPAARERLRQELDEAELNPAAIWKEESPRDSPGSSRGMVPPELGVNSPIDPREMEWMESPERRHHVGSDCRAYGLSSGQLGTFAEFRVFYYAAHASKRPGAQLQP